MNLKSVNSALANSRMTTPSAFSNAASDGLWRFGDHL